MVGDHGTNALHNNNQRTAQIIIPMSWLRRYDSLSEVMHSVLIKRGMQLERFGSVGTYKLGARIIITCRVTRKYSNRVTLIIGMGMRQLIVGTKPVEYKASEH